MTIRIGTLSDPSLYYSETIHTSLSYPATTWVTMPTRVFIASDTTARVTVELQYDAFLSDLPRGTTGVDATGSLGYLRLRHVDTTPTPIQSKSKLLIGTTALPALCVDRELSDLVEEWIVTTGTFVAREDTTRITLQSQYNDTTPIGTAFDTVSIILMTDNPVDALQFILDTFVAGATYNALNFHQTRLKLFAWRYGTYLTTPGNTDNLIQSIGQQCNCLITRDPYGRYTINPLTDDRESVFDFSHMNNIFVDGLAVESAPTDIYYTHIYVYFGTYKGGSQSATDFSGLTYATPTVTTDPGHDELATACSEVLVHYAMEHRLEVFAWWIQDFDTANLLLEALVGRHTSRGDALIFQTFLDALPVQVGQAVTVTHPLIYAGAPTLMEIINKIFHISQMRVALQARIIDVITPVGPVADDIEIDTDRNSTLVFSIVGYVAVTYPATLDVTSIDFDPISSGYQQTYRADMGGGRVGTFTADTNGQITFHPDFDDIGDFTATYTVKDNFGTISNLGTITITVSAAYGAGKTAGYYARPTASPMASAIAATDMNTAVGTASAVKSIIDDPTAT